MTILNSKFQVFKIPGGNPVLRSVIIEISIHETTIGTQQAGKGLRLAAQPDLRCSKAQALAVLHLTFKL